MNIVCITDQNHGWGLVSAEQLKKARMTEKDISAFSYCTPNREIYALEEDVDLTKYLNKLDSMGVKYNIVDKYIPDEEHPDNPRTWDYVHPYM
tara:strand:+ start:765 stop:1043 length:279 start_codon:yes stop_codon:yes gene_type:complete